MPILTEQSRGRHLRKAVLWVVPLLVAALFVAFGFPAVQQVGPWHVGRFEVEGTWSGRHRFGSSYNPATRVFAISASDVACEIAKPGIHLTGMPYLPSGIHAPTPAQIRWRDTRYLTWAVGRLRWAVGPF